MPVLVMLALVVLLLADMRFGLTGSGTDRCEVWADDIADNVREMDIQKRMKVGDDSVVRHTMYDTRIHTLSTQNAVLVDLMRDNSCAIPDRLFD